jgi:ribosome-binding protein aMBF1 (putative translation factor)
MKIKCDFCGKKKECKILKAVKDYKVYICKDCFLKIRSED